MKDQSDLLNKLEELQDACVNVDTLVKDTMQLCNDYIEWLEEQL